jgi:hypothetical protein
MAFIPKPCAIAAAAVQRLKLMVGQALDPDELVLRLGREDEFVELRLQGEVVAVLGVLDEEDHQEGDDGRAGIDDQLPGLGEVKGRTGRGPDRDDQHAKREGWGASGNAGGAARQSGERAIEIHA